MSILKVANMAGVSASTVSRVINDHPSVAPETVATVRKAIREMDFTPSPRRGRRRAVPNDPKTKLGAIGFLVFGTTGSHVAPAFESLLRGVSAEANERGFELFFNFVTDRHAMPARVAEAQVSGLLVHGRPNPELEPMIKRVPTVWLMAGAYPPRWGDQVMPDNTLIGDMAAKYVLECGRKHAAFLSAAPASWSLEIRELSFAQRMADHGGTVELLQARLPDSQDFWEPTGMTEAIEDLVAQFLRLSPRPNAIFVAEDRQVPAAYAALTRAGVSVGPDREVLMISCNNEMPHLAALRHAVATIDIRAESIGRRGVEQLARRVGGSAYAERIRLLVAPSLVTPAGHHI
jgi:LacI family transcriptional regulator